MTPEGWQQVKDLLATALELPPQDRSAYLDQHFSLDNSMRQELELLLRDEDELNSQFLRNTALSGLGADILPEEGNRWGGRLVGVYRIVEQIGAGGMGEVYRAVRDDDQYQKQVALKLIRAGQDSAFVISRFRNERQILASLDHPNIGRLLDGGTVDALPYFVMELIEGQPITDYCDQHKLSISKRLQLFSQICSAVQYAHQRLIIHRDIKPGNILVTADGTPKLLDFGIAKILDPETASSALDATMTAFRVLTPQYASPEQITGEPMTTASDVYSLGMVLYELLTGCSPYRLASATSKEMIDTVCRIEPVKPSAIVQSAAGTNQSRRSVEIAVNRDTSPANLRKRLAGDLDNIVLMALRKEPSRRYASVGELLEDLRRHCENIPVAARKDAAGYRISKFVARHKAGVTAATAIIATLIIGFAVALQEARIAKHRFNDVRSLANSLIFDVHDSIKDLPGSTPAKKVIVDRALQYLNVLAQESTGDVALQRELASAYERLGSVQGDYLENNLGDNQGTLASYQKALAIRNQIDTASKDWNDRLALAQDYRLVAHQLWANGDPRGARDPIQRAISISQDLNDAYPNYEKILYELGFDYEVSGTIGYPGNAPAREKILDDYRHALVIAEELVRIRPNDVRNLYGYAVDLSEVGKWLEGSNAREALKYYQKCVEIDLKLIQLSTDLRYQRGLAVDYGSVASVYDDLGDYPHALENNLKDLAIQQEVARKDPKNQLLRRGVAIATMNSAASFMKTGKQTLALGYSKRGLEIMRDLVSSAPEKGYGSRIFATMLVYRGTVLTQANQLEAAMAEIERGRSIYESLYTAGAGDRTNVAGADVKLAEAAFRAGHDDEAARYFQDALNIAEPLVAGNNLEAIYAAADAHSGLGDLSAKKARRSGQTVRARKTLWAEAQSQYQHSLDAWHRLEHPNHSSPINGFQVGDPVLVEKELKVAEAALSATH